MPRKTKRELELESLVQQMMARLADLLDADQFNNIEAMVLAANVPYPPIKESPCANP